MAATADAKQTAPESGLKVRYGEHPDQFVYVHLPPGEISSGILMNVIHGGFWKGCWTVQNTNSPQMLQAWLDKGVAVVLIEYRRNDEEGGGWPRSNDDVLEAVSRCRDFVGAAVDQAEGYKPTSVEDLKVGVQGHSAGGTLSLWVTQKALLEEKMNVAACFSIAPVGDLLAGWEMNLGEEGGAIQNYLGEAVEATPAESPTASAKLDAASPVSLLPMLAPAVVVAASEDTDVPPMLVRQFYSKLVEQRDEFSGAHAFIEIEGADHLEITDGTSEAWNRSFEAFWNVLVATS